jgi:hypothetical protein
VFTRGRRGVYLHARVLDLRSLVSPLFLILLYRTAIFGINTSRRYQDLQCCHSSEIALLFPFFHRFIAGEWGQNSLPSLSKFLFSVKRKGTVLVNRSQARSFCLSAHDIEPFSNRLSVQLPHFVQNPRSTRKKCSSSADLLVN